MLPPDVHFQRMFLFGALPLLLVLLVWWLMPVTSVEASEEQGEPRSKGLNGPTYTFSPGRLRGTLLLCGGIFMGLLLIYSTGTWPPTITVDRGIDLRAPLDPTISFNPRATSRLPPRSASRRRTASTPSSSRPSWARSSLPCCPAATHPRHHTSTAEIGGVSRRGVTVSAVTEAGSPHRWRAPSAQPGRAQLGDHRARTTGPF
ncbi:hypothetical protein ACFWPQ_34255 [Streptomyces sp. NPDC058464]|uniref:hypothetical protein n=1 Tax=Streptomyces sp. NPDC058464 TaxID=3346511 RepID=UPI003648CB9C